jgi:uncharacterized protein (DUF362 family)
MRDGSIGRREFLAGTLVAAGALASGAFPPPASAAGKEASVSRATGPSPRENVMRAVKAVGGMGAFVSRGDVVVVKPNIGWDRSPAQAANTDPEVVTAVIELCLAAGAKEVRVFDRTCNEARRCYASSGIQEAVEAFARKHKAGDAVRIYHVEDRKFVTTDIPGALTLSRWPLYRDALEADRLINVPVAKHHTLGIVTAGLKNWMGLMGGNRGQVHFRLPECLVDLHAALPARLTVVDATRVLLRNGPSGGSLSDVKEFRTVLASADVAAADVTAAHDFFGLSPDRVPHLQKALESGRWISSPSAIRLVPA